ncbi:LOW QUALITY PROTEIN: putative cyclic nucleotide-gated ion channel 5 [Cinnamomum micranthum f. kanehirae]|uniref:Putative cyclic nucleotide-gated ion channel 5 n=1 Tax=Cinnamomum micranthum f. kanehirae TaxID=337451 RepID=A0A3S3NRD2_9MAGN|nr:LOW QUALITY PROTEIN: putative cyclic nucleotide-gated ion channel 5 [Cinnamomum micranthum f. kanehirae]
MLFIIHGRLESVTTDGGRTGFFNRSLLKEGDFCGEELLTWALDPRSGANLPSSTRTVKALKEVEAFALTAEELKFVASQFRRLHSRQVQSIPSASTHSSGGHGLPALSRQHGDDTPRGRLQKCDTDKRKEKTQGPVDNSVVRGSTASLGATIYASRFAANALRGVHRLQNMRSARELVTMQKPTEPDFTVGDGET